MNYFYNQMFNPQYVNPDYYAMLQAQAAKQYQATYDLCEAVNKLDAEHQQQAFYACLTVLAAELGWK